MSRAVPSIMSSMKNTAMKISGFNTRPSPEPPSIHPRLRVCTRRRGWRWSDQARALLNQHCPGLCLSNDDDDSLRRDDGDGLFLDSHARPSSRPRLVALARLLYLTDTRPASLRVGARRLCPGTGQRRRTHIPRASRPAFPAFASPAASLPSTRRRVASAMASANGTLTLSSPRRAASPLPAAKRKRSSPRPVGRAQAASSAGASAPLDDPAPAFQALLGDMVAVLKRCVGAACLCYASALAAALVDRAR